MACVVLCFSPHRVATSRSYACTSASQFWQEIYAEIRTFLTCRGRYCICRQRGRFSCWSCSLCCCLRCKSFFPGVRPGVKGFRVRGVEDERQFDVLPGGGRFATAFNLKNNIFKGKRKLNLSDRARKLLSRPASFGSSILTKK